MAAPPQGHPGVERLPPEPVQSEEEDPAQHPGVLLRLVAGEDLPEGGVENPVGLLAAER